MVESFASGITNGRGYNSDGEEEREEEDYVELLLDHHLGNGKVKAIAYCDELEILCIGFNDGSMHSFHFNICLDKEDNAKGSDEEEDDDDEYGEEDF